MSEVPALTVAILALNEERNLSRLVPSLAWGDEVLVVDGGSRDRSVAVARLLGARVVERAFDSFAQQRNFALEQANGQWVFFIDADERPTRRLSQEIRRVIADARLAAFRIPIHSRVLGRRFRFSGTQDDRPIRLVRKDRARWVGAVHERAHVLGGVGTLTAGLEHVTIPDLDAFLKKMRRYTALEARARVARGRPPRRFDPLLAPAVEVFRRLVWKQGYLDGLEGWLFCLLSGLSEFVLAREHGRRWSESTAARETARDPSMALAG